VTVCLLQVESVKEDLTRMVFIMAGLPRPLEASILKTGAHAGARLI
jgi:hypothetical protein